MKKVLNEIANFVYLGVVLVICLAFLAAYAVLYPIQKLFGYKD